MKHVLLIGVLLTTLCGRAQPTFPFPSGDVRWTVNSVEMGSSYPSRTYATMGDSTFNGFTYQKIGWVENTGLPFDPEDMNYSGSMRDEEGRWLFVPAGGLVEYPLFDFTGEVGDVVAIENPYSFIGEPTEYVVQSITYLAIQNGTRRVWELFSENPIDQQFFIEGIGSTYGLFGHSTFLADAGEQLICMEQNSELIYRIPEAESCYIPKHCHRRHGDSATVDSGPQSCKRGSGPWNEQS